MEGEREAGEEDRRLSRGEGEREGGEGRSRNDPLPGNPPPFRRTQSYEEWMDDGTPTYQPYYIPEYGFVINDILSEGSRPPLSPTYPPHFTEEGEINDPLPGNPPPFRRTQSYEELTHDDEEWMDDGTPTYQPYYIPEYGFVINDILSEGSRPPLSPTFPPHFREEGEINDRPRYRSRPPFSPTYPPHFTEEWMDDEEELESPRIIRISEEQMNDGLCCPICLDDFAVNEDVGELKCHHVFHLACITNWFRQSPTCPTCRR